jgi:alkylation response protein AidB-like acyl-CoA dehydrogenase
VSQQTETTQPAQPAQPAKPAQPAAQAGGSGSRLPDMTYTEQETELRAAVRSVLEDKAAAAAVLARTETPDTYDAALWRILAAEIGCAGLLIPASYGGAGASFREAAVVAEEIGRCVAPVPFLGSAVIATVALLAIDDGELLTKLATGTTTAALAVPFDSVPGMRFEPTVKIGVAASDDPDGTYRLSGSVLGVADALPADVLIVPADGVPVGLYAVSAQAAGGGVVRTPVTSLDMTRQLCDLTLENVPARRLAGGPVAQAALAAALRAGAGILAAEQLGLAERALDITLAYAKQRYQFARPIGSFQALKHRFADWWVAVTQARAASRYAAACLAGDDQDVAVAVALAKAVCSDTAVLAGQEMVQLHGGIGFTWEHPAHLYLKRAKSSALALGTADRHRASLADLVNLPPAP